MEIQKFNGVSINTLTPTLPTIDTSSFEGVMNAANKLARSFRRKQLWNLFAGLVGSQLTGLMSDGIGNAFGDSGIGRLIGNVFGNGLGSIGSTVLDNYLKGNTLMQGIGKNLGASLQGAASGLAADFAGKGVNALMGDSKLGNFMGGATSSALGQVLGGGIGNPLVFGSNVAGSALSSMLGPSKEYGGKYGNITLTMDSIYGGIQGAAGLFGPVGMGVSAAMSLNKGLSNLFGSTDGMTVQDAILGSAFMLAPVKWLNAGLGKKTGSFDNQSWLNQEKANSFMLNGFGDLGERFDLARYEANKKYGLFSQHARRKAQRNIDFANNAWDLMLAMADQNELQNIRSLYMSSINNLRYAQMLGGGLKPLLIGKQGMKILNNQTNHNIGLRLLSAAALIDNKAIILSAQGGTKVRKPAKPLPRKPATREENPELWGEWERREAEQLAARLQIYDLERQAATQRAETNTRHALRYSNLATGVAEIAQLNALFEPVTQESLQNSNTEKVRQELLANKNEYFDRGMDFINAAGFADLGVNVAAPLLLRGFRWAFNRAGLLVKVPILETSYSIGYPGYPHYYNPTTNQWDFSSAASDVKQGIDNLKEWMNNPIYRKAAEANKAEAEAMELTYIPYYERPEYIRALENPNIRFKNLNSSVGGESNLSGEVTINTGTTLNPILVVRHEMGHVAGLGKISEAAAVNPDNTLLLKELKYLRYKSNQVYKEGSEYAGQVDLNRNSFEGIQNARDFGEELGIKIGQEYPGYEKALEIVNSYPENGFKAGLKKMFRLDKEHMPYVWKALAGTLFTLAATLYDSHKKGGKILKAQNGTYFKPDGKYSLISSEHSLPEVLIKGKNKINAETFLGKITKLLGGSPTTVRFVDEGSSTALLIRPYGYILGGLDLGSDIYDTTKGDENKDWTDVALDAASLLPWINKLGLKNNPKGLLKWMYNNRKTINNVSNTAKGVDYVNDSHILGEFKESNPLLIVTK